MRWADIGACMRQRTYINVKENSQEKPTATYMELLYGRIVAKEVMQCHIRFVRIFFLCVQFHPAEGYINLVYGFRMHLHV